MVLASALLDAHEAVAWAFVFTNAAVGVWALAAHRWERARSPWLWRAVVVAQLVVVAQAVIGSLLVANEQREPPELHDLYGYFAVFTIGILYSYRNQNKAWQYLLYGFGSLFLMGLGIRGMVLQ